LAKTKNAKHICKTVGDALNSAFDVLLEPGALKMPDLFFFGLVERIQCKEPSVRNLSDGGVERLLCMEFLSFFSLSSQFVCVCVRTRVCWRKNPTIWCYQVAPWSQNEFSPPIAFASLGRCVGLGC
jgi:hypothetical protein